MSSEVCIRADGVGKRYRIGATQGIGRYRTLREDIIGLAARRRKKGGGQGKEFWALKDVSFEIRAGETVGIIGRNGAGKSTLLKILARITPPTSGRGEIVGRVASLLEVGTGFHPELTGRENIMLSAAIMGMRRHEVLRRFDEIVEFSGLATFLDTPVKRYSSGMYMRLAFSVAAHLEPEILLVDEVLAVGDAAFQKKCLGRMEELSEIGRTVLFVSHSMQSVLRLCPRILLLDDGHIAVDGNGSRVVEEYLGRGGGAALREWPEVTSAPGDEYAKLKAVRIVDHRRKLTPDVDIREPVYVEVEYWDLSSGSGHQPVVSVGFYDNVGTCLFLSHSSNIIWHGSRSGDALVRTRCRIPGNLLSEGSVIVHAALLSYETYTTHIALQDVVAFHVVDPSEGDGARGRWTGEFPGAVRPMLEWEGTVIEDDAQE